MIGQILDGHEILRLLGAGGMGEVYLARGASGLRAIKTVRADRDLAPQATGRFRREVLALGKLRHPNIVQIVDAGRLASGGLYLAMEYVAGPNLQAAIDRHGPYPVRDGLAILTQLASALAFAHAQGVVHRDLKPANILIAGGDPAHVKVIDFGLAKITADEGITRVTEDQQVLGSPQYWAPEQSTHADVGPAADIYALGGIAYYVLSGLPLYGQRPSVALVYAHQCEIPAPLGGRCPDLVLPPGLEELVAACVAKAPSERPSGAELAAKLEALRAQASPDAPPRRRRRFPSASTSDHAEALTSQIRQVLLDLAGVLAADVAAVEALQNALSELELELAMLDADLEVAVEPRQRAGLAAQRDVLATTIADQRASLGAAFRALYDAVDACRGTASDEAQELFDELDELDEQYQIA
jgi:serine/threonine-protein kinase